MRRIVFVVLALALVLSVRTSAQMPTAQKWENVEWYMVMNWQFTGADAESATAIFWDHIMPVMAETWLGTTCLRVLTGEGGVTCFGPMADGLAEMEWEMSPDDVRFFSLFMEREGEEGMELFETFMSAATGFTMNIALKHMGGM
jgi:hypothetical protein